MNKNIELYSSEKVVSNNVFQLPKPEFNKPIFAKPEMQRFTNPSGSKWIDITEEATAKQFEVMPGIAATIKSRPAAKGKLLFS
ncbi:hypothetical protein IYZ83_000350 [Wolbachia pipientis]|uniref:hypothetical protein n=1 Tax=Wolbachia pipientis TaxID=955 RepID=UPI001F255AA7|nr:hypothetical protein [Wolbachia pipientis]UIP91727.1 hypothetical protein IYZ83_000350 [Wolbachia pipientis]